MPAGRSDFSTFTDNAESQMPDYRKFIEKQPVTASTPCRVDMGGTLDIPTFFLPLRRSRPCTVNIAINLRTVVRLSAFRKGAVRVSSTGLGEAEFAPETAPFDHPLGLIFAVAAHFGLDGIEISIESGSPVRSALGGSSAAVSALVGALAAVAEKQGEPGLSRKETALLARNLESAVARVPCGFQDQLAAVFGGVHAWHWTGDIRRCVFRREPLMDGSGAEKLGRRLLVAYCGAPHDSKDINGQWVSRFLAGKDRDRWLRIAQSVRRFADCLRRQDFSAASDEMNTETAIRREMTPEVFDATGALLSEEALAEGCGVRFAGAGGGGCLWALGEEAAVGRLRLRWADILSRRQGAGLLDAGVDSRGLLCQL